MGVVGPDEPRYAAIGQSMARSGDWITPTLWGHPWFEKPPLLYWLTAAGNLAGLGPDLAPRLPVALLSLAFLALLWWQLQAAWDKRVATYAAVFCATSAGWLTYSRVGVTDLPMSAFFTAAVLSSLGWVAEAKESGKDRNRLWIPAACLGIAALGKALVPLALFLPIPAIGIFHGGWRRLLDWLRPAPVIAFAFTALPWYSLCTARNGSEFLRVLFVEQQFNRLHSTALQHVQPWWFYLPVLLLLLFPWFPLLGGLPGGLRPLRRDARVQALAGVVIFGMLLFSAALNKLPGYVLPLVPSLCILMALATAAGEAGGATGAGRLDSGSTLRVAAVTALIGLFPAMTQVVPAALGHGFRAAAIPWGLAALGVALAAVAGLGIARRFGQRSVTAVAMLAAAGFLWFEASALPSLDQAASARPSWLANHAECGPAGASRNLLYGLYYYAGKQLADCAVLDLNIRPVVR